MIEDQRPQLIKKGRMKALALSKVDFPIYVVKSFGQRHLIIAGGGGQAKTGVSNKIIIYEIVATSDSCQLVQEQEFDTESDAIMTGSLTSLPVNGARFATAGSPTDMLRIYDINFSLSNNLFKIDRLAVPKTPREDAGYKCLASIQEKNILIGGGMDGKITVWTGEDNFEKFSQFQAHDQEIDEIDAHPDGIHVITLSRKTDCIVWNILEERKLHEIKRTKVNLNDDSLISYHFRSCRYGEKHHKNNSVVHLYTVTNPPNGAKASSNLTQWETKGYEMVKQVVVGLDPIMVLAVSKDGIYIGLGTANGSVYIHHSLDLQQIYNIQKAHGIFVTSLEFLPPSGESKLLTNSDTCSLISVSIDRRIIMHRPSRNEQCFGMMWRILFFSTFFFVIHYFMMKS